MALFDHCFIQVSNCIAELIFNTECLFVFVRSKNEYEEIADETLESITEYFDEIVEKSNLEDVDVSYGVTHFISL